MSIEIRVYDRADPLDLVGSYLGSLSEDTARKITAPENRAGAWTFTVPRDSDDAELLEQNNVVRFVVDGEYAFAARIGPWDQQTIAAGEEADEDLVLSGEGILDTLGDARVFQHPDCPLRKTDTRYWNFAALDYFGWGSWPAAVQLWRHDDEVDNLYGTDIPGGLDDGTAYWIWGTDYDEMADPPQAVGKCFKRRAVEFVSSGDFAFIMACDDGYRFFIDGVLIGENGEAFTFREADRYDVFLTAGVHHLAWECVNIERPVSSTNSAGLIYSVYLTENGGELADLAIHSDDDTQVLAYPATPPGMTPGAIVISLIDEAQARGGLAIWDYDFTEELDSNGDPWADEIELAARVGGEGVLDVVYKLTEIYVDVAVDFETITLRMFNKGGLDSGPALVLETAETDPAGAAIVELQHSGDPTAGNAIVVRGANGIDVVVDDGVPHLDPSEPRIEAFIEAASAPSSEAATLVGEAVRATHGSETVKATFELDPAVVPWADIWSGKIVTLPDSHLAPASARVLSVQLTDIPPDQDGFPEGSYEITGEAMLL